MGLAQISPPNNWNFQVNKGGAMLLGKERVYNPTVLEKIREAWAREWLRMTGFAGGEQITVTQGSRSSGGVKVGNKQRSQGLNISP